jgi:hypothetical protein
MRQRRLAPCGWLHGLLFLRIQPVRSALTHQEEDMGDLSKNFNSTEFACKCGCGLKYPSPKLAGLLQKIRDAAGVPVKVVSGWRCTEHNAAEKSKVLGEQGLIRGRCGDETASAHTRGEAADIVVDGFTKAQTYQLIEILYKNGQVPELQYTYMIKNSAASVHVGVDEKKRSGKFGGEQ